MPKMTKNMLLFPLSLVIFEIATYLANDMYLPGLLRLKRDLGLSQDQAQFTLLVWFMGSASLQLFIGPLSDRFGRRLPVIIGASIFTLTSLVCAITSDFTAMLIARFFQGATICSVVVAGYASIHESFDTKTAIKMIGIMGSITVLAPAFGPICGSLVLQFTSWRGIFWILAGWGAIALTLLSFNMPETNREPSALDLKAIFRDYFSILKNKQFLRYTFSMGFLFLGFISWIVESPFVIMTTFGRTEIEFGLIQLIIFGSFVIGTQITRIMVERVEPTTLIEHGQAIALVSAVFLILFSAVFKEPLYWVTFAMVINSIGTALVFGPLNRLAVDSCAEPMGRRMAIASTLTAFFGTFAIVLVTLVNDKTLLSLCIPISGGVACSLLIYWGLNNKST